MTENLDGKTETDIQQLRQQGHSHEADNMNIIRDGLLAQFVNTLRRIQGAAEVPQQAPQSRSVHVSIICWAFDTSVTRRN